MYACDTRRINSIKAVPFSTVVPFPKLISQFPVENPGANLKQKVGALLAPAYL